MPGRRSGRSCSTSASCIRAATPYAVNRVKYTWSEAQGSFGILDLPGLSGFPTFSPTSYGHSNAAGNIAVGAASWYATVPFSNSGLVPPNDKDPSNPIDLSACVPACLNDFSSAGGIQILLDKFGNRLVQPVVRRVPSVTGPDGGNTSFFFCDSSYDDDDGDGSEQPVQHVRLGGARRAGDEYPNFFGTSASAPHVAAVAALMLDKNPGLTQSEVRQILEATAATRPISQALHVESAAHHDADHRERLQLRRGCRPGRCGGGGAGLGPA